MPGHLDDLVATVGELGIADRQLLGSKMIAGVSAEDKEKFFTQMLMDVEPESVKNAVVAVTGTLPHDEKLSALSETAASLSNKATAEQVVELVSSAVGNPGAAARDRLWTIVVGAFAFVLVASFTAIATGMFISRPSDSAVKPELVLTMFTSVVGFLAGLFVPSPAANKR